MLFLLYVHSMKGINKLISKSPCQGLYDKCKSLIKFSINMKKLEKLKSKEISKKNVKTVFGGLLSMAPEYTVYNSNCVETGTSGSWDCGDQKKD